jgi:hypothetical protein
LVLSYLPENGAIQVCGLWHFKDLAFGQGSVEYENAGDSKVKDRLKAIFQRGFAWYQ